MSTKATDGSDGLTIHIQGMTPMDGAAIAREIDWQLRTDRMMILGRGMTMRKLRWYERLWRRFAR